MSRRVSVLGPVRYAFRGRDIAVTGSLASLLGFLSVHASRGRRVHRDRIASALWPDRAEPLARRALTDALYRLGQHLDDDALVIRDADLVGLGDVDVDLDTFAVLVDAPDVTSQRAALALYRDDLLVGLDAHWVVGRREATRLRMLAALHAVWESESTSGEHNWGIATAQHWALVDPWDEHSHRAVLRSLAAAGQHRRALAYFEWLAGMLRDEMGVTPGAETLAVRDRLEREEEIALDRVVGGQTAFVGRAAERGVLVTALDDTIAGRGGLTVVVGDAGIGKTRLLDEMSAAARWRGVDVVRAGIDEFGGGAVDRDDLGVVRPGGPLVDALADALTPTRRAQMTDIVEERWLTQLDARLATIRPQPLADRRATPVESHLAAALPHVLSGLAALAPQVILLDDMQWADSEAWSLLEALHPRLGEMAVHVVVACRLGEIRDQATPWTLIRTWDRTGSVIVELVGMTAPELHQLAAAAIGVPLADAEVAALLTATSGNPLTALAELGSSSATTVSPDLGGFLDRQLASVSAAARRCLDVAALLGNRFEFELWRAAVAAAEPLVAPSVVAASGELERARLLIAGPAGLRFTHDVLRRHVVARLAPLERQRLHRTLLPLVREAFPADVLTALWHAEGSDDRDAIGELSVEAGIAALGASAYTAATEHFSRALDVVGDNPVQRAAQLMRFGALLGLSRALDVQGERDRQRQTVDELVQLGRSLGDRHYVEALRTQADLSFLVGDYPAARAAAERGLALLVEQPDRALEAALLQTSSNTARELGDHAEAEALALRCHQWYVELGDRAGAATMTDMLGGLAWRTGDKQRAADLHASAASEFGAIGALIAQARALNNLGTAQWDLGRFHDAWATHADAVRVCRELGDVRGEGDNIDNMGGVRWALGDMAGAIAMYETALELRRGSDDPWGVAISLGNLADAHRSAGELDQSLVWAREALDVSRAAGIARTEATSLQALGATQFELGLIADALDALTAADAAHVALGDRPNSVETRATHARALLANDDVIGARSLADSLLRDVRPDDAPRMRQTVYQCAFECWCDAPTPHDAIGHLARAQLAMMEYLDPFDDDDRDRIVSGHPLHRRTSAAVQRHAERVEVRLAAAGTPLGRTLRDDDRVTVTWSLSEPADSTITDAADRRRRVITRLVAQAGRQGGAATDDDLATALGVSRRTIIRDMATLIDGGDTPTTRRRSRQIASASHR